MPMKLFISWSDQRSKSIALALKSWLPTVIHGVKPWVSEKDIDKGTLGIVEIFKSLQDADCGIVCVTPESLTRQWLNFEAGALSKAVDRRVWTYLYGLSYGEVTGPLKEFQHTLATKEDTLVLVKSIHKRASTDLAESEIDELFESRWLKLEAKLKSLPQLNITSRRSVEEMVADLHQHVRSTKPLGISITSVQPSSVQQPITISGISKEDHPTGQLILLIVQTGDEFRPNAPITIKDRKWSASVWFNKPGKNIVHVVRPNELGKALIEYYWSVHSETDKKLGKGKGMWIGIKMSRLPPGLDIEASVEIEYRPEAAK